MNLKNTHKTSYKELENFDKWNEIKKRTHIKSNNVGFKKRETFWVRLGQNIGSEEYGKGNEFQRPVVIIKKLTNDLFFGIPLSSVLKDGAYFYNFTYTDKKGKNKTNCAMLLQLKAFDKKRLMGRIGIMNKKDFHNMLQQIRELFIPLSQEREAARRLMYVI